MRNNKLETHAQMSWAFDNSYARDLPGFYVPWEPAKVARPHLVYFNGELARELGLALENASAEHLAVLFSGNALPEGAAPIAQVYAGHQFGQFSPQLGDGRALLIGEVIDRQGRRQDLAFKGSGRTPFSRRGDGKAAVGPMLREVLMGEALHALGIPTTRALAVIGTGETVRRDRVLPGAILTRVAGSHLRVGTFEFFAARGDHARVKQLADYSVARHFPEIAGSPDAYLAFLRAVVRQQAALIARWMGVGFIHGVMNTDNMSIAGETIDFGPCAFLETYDPGTVFSSIDEYGRYAYGNQPAIAQWNLARLAETLLPLLADDPDRAVTLASDAIEAFSTDYRTAWREEMRRKLGLTGQPGSEEDDARLAEDWLAMIRAQQADFTLAWRTLADCAEGEQSGLRAQLPDDTALSRWLARWQARLALEPTCSHGHPLAERLRQANPWVIPRNHRVEEALTAASEQGDLAPFNTLLAALSQPFRQNADFAHLAEPAPPGFTAAYQTFCGT